MIFILLLLISFSFSTKANASEIWQYSTSSPSNRIAVITATPYGIYIGEFDNRAIFPTPYNGIYKSSDITNSWIKSGLEKKGITGIAFKEGILFAGTYTSGTTPNGVYKSPDKGKTWIHTGLQGSGTALITTSDGIFYGTASTGLHRSLDLGNTWEQVLGEGLSFGIKALSGYNNNLIAATTKNTTYISIDSGQTWQEISFLKDKIIGSLYIKDDLILAGTENNKGLLKSTNKGQTWVEVPQWSGKSAGPITTIENKLYVGGYSTDHNTHGIFMTSDKGETWIDISEGHANNNAPIKAISAIFTKPFNKLFSSVTTQGVFSYNIKPFEHTLEPFMDLPWAYLEFSKEINKVSSVFDHKYPLLAYSYWQEPSGTNNKTMDYKGIEKPIPQMWYSSHNGVDFALPFGSPIKAAADGYATYSYNLGTGHMIKIDHKNGIQTGYMHLQNKNLITQSNTIATFVKKGEVIGLVGMSGNTSGPHLHLSTSIDKNQDGKFNEYPDGLIDPFGWSNKNFSDPWSIYAWKDLLGQHSGSKSTYLWKTPLTNQTKIYNEQPIKLALDTKEFDIPANISDHNSTLHIENILALAYENNINIGGGFDLEFTNLLGEEAPVYNDIVTTIDYSQYDISNIEEESLSLFHWDTTTNIWNKISSSINNETKKLTANINKTGQYAIYGLAKDLEAPQTEWELVGNTKSINNYINEVILNLHATDLSSIKHIFYKLSEDTDWEEYIEPVIVTQEGLNQIKIKAQDIHGNIETEKTITFTISKTLWNKIIKIKETKFLTQ